jgi:DNA polymerase type B, organellar and viral.
MLLLKIKKNIFHSQKKIFVGESGERGNDVYITLKFIDSFRFLPSSLDKLSQTLESYQCVEIQKYFPDQHKFELIRRKGVFPYSYIDCISRLDDTELPSKENFFDILRGENISDEEYNRAIDVWRTFQCQTLGEYSDTYLISDVLLLADIFENFRKVSLQNYNLDPAQYVTAPSLSWDAMLRKTGVTLELLTDIDMLHFFRKGIRGGVSQCSNRKAIANNSFVRDYDVTKPNSFIIYLDATNLYGWAMSQNLPMGEFRWLTFNEISNFNPLLIDDDYMKGYVLEVDIEYPEYLHDVQNDLPFCPENFSPPDSKHSKLLLTLQNKNKYIIHYRNLKQCLMHGLVVSKIHKILEFSQSPWLKPYIDLNTQLRNSSKNAFEAVLFKFFTNSIYGKTMENLDKRVDVKLLSHWENIGHKRGAESYVNMPNFKSSSVFSENLVAVHMGHLSVCYNKPLYAGFSILDISKTVIYEFFYNFIKKPTERKHLFVTQTRIL